VLRRRPFSLPYADQVPALAALADPARGSPAQPEYPERLVEAALYHGMAGYLAQALEQGAELSVIGSHTVGAPDGGEGLVLTGWATGAGDLRVAHFVGLHGLQVVPLFAIGLALLAPRVPLLADVTTRTWLVAIGALGYAGLVGLLVWQALRGQALGQPDSVTVLTGLALLASVSLAGLAVVWARRTGTGPVIRAPRR
jgi:hypothetical protein